jgi:hypothetical protein
MNGFLSWRTVQIEEVVWLALVAYALVRVHLPARNEARKDVWEAEHNNRHLPPAVRIAAETIARGRFAAEGYFVIGWLIYGAIGVRGLLFLPSADRPRQISGIAGLLAGALMMMLASRAWTRAREKVRRFRGTVVVEGDLTPPA